MYKNDVAIIGGGIGGLMTAYQLSKKGKQVILYEKGNSLNKRICIAKNGIPCQNCKVCAISSGLAGAGAFSDGKFNLGTAYGGTLGEYIGEDLAMKYIKYVDDILCSMFSSEVEIPKIYPSNDELKNECLQNNLYLLDMNVRHLGTDNNYTIMNKMINKLSENITILTNTEVSVRQNGKIFEILDKNNNILSIADNIVIATGRNGSDFVKKFCKDNSINIKNNAVDIGVRVEMKDIIWKKFSNKIYEPKILYKTPTFEDKTRSFCFNQGGIVSAENNDGIITANGHSFSSSDKKTDNCNFAILSSIHFTQPFNQPTEYAKYISKLANIIGNNNVIVQRFGDLIRGRRTNEHRLSQNSVKPTLEATTGDISLVLPHRILTNIIETLYAFNKVAPGCTNDDTLLYGCEAKYYSVVPNMNKNFEALPNVYFCGDGSGVCRGLSQSGAMGLYIADCILNK